MVKAAVKKRDPDVLSKFVLSNVDMPFDGDILIHGPPKVGKTFLAASASEFCPEVLPAEKLVALEDMLWLQIDAGATDGFHEANLLLPDRVINVRKVIAETGSVERGLMMALDVARMVLDKCPEIRYIVTDTLSAADKFICEHWDTNCPLSRTGEKIVQMGFGMVFNTHKRFYNRLSLLPCNLITLCHSRVLIDDGQNTQEAKKRKAEGIPGSFDIVPDITGKARNLYVGNASLELVVMAKKNPRTGKLMRTVAPYGANGFEGGTRFQVLEEEEPAHLGQIFQKIRNASN